MKFADNYQILKPTNPRILGVLTCILLTGCMSSQREENMQANIRQLETKLYELDKQIITRDKNVDNMKATVDDANRRAQNSKSELEDMRRQLSMTQGAIDELRIKMTRVQESVGTPAGKEANTNDDQVAVLEKRIAALEGGEENTTNTATAEPIQKTVGGLKYKNAAAAAKVFAQPYSKKDYKKVVELTTATLSTNPPADQLEIALLMRGESYFYLKQFENAAVDLNDYLTKFPKSKKRPRALLFAGDTQTYLRQNDQAKIFYSECTDKFPGREECKAAKERLIKLGG